MDYIKRVNLSFDIRRDQDREVYEILSLIQHKAAYISKAVLTYEVGNHKAADKNLIKQALREVLKEMNFTVSEENQDREEDIPEEIFDIFEQM
ncbi:hypothetical protein SDC9_90817 [bioreactor metagenome]|uniref:Uncharacterized protein n=1 Tax=bioreactor metagenome TaxID=1076179 RepID=A0A644ZT10_9ZZZZ